MEEMERWPGEILKARHENYTSRLDELIDKAKEDKEKGQPVSKDTTFSIIDLIGNMAGNDILRLSDFEREQLTTLSVVAFINLMEVRYSEFINRYPVDVLGLPLVIDFKGSDPIDIESDFLTDYPNELFMKYLNISNSLRSGISANQVVCNMVEVDYKTGKSSPEEEY